MMSRIMTTRPALFLLGTSLTLAACAGAPCPGYGPCTGKVLTGPYDQADLYEDAQGNPLQGWAQMKYGPESGDDR
jgi:hypothetical protein